LFTTRKAADRLEATQQLEVAGGGGHAYKAFNQTDGNIVTPDPINALYVHLVKNKGQHHIGSQHEIIERAEGPSRCGRSNAGCRPPAKSPPIPSAASNSSGALRSKADQHDDPTSTQSRRKTVTLISAPAVVRPPAFPPWPGDAFPKQVRCTHSAYHPVDAQQHLAYQQQASRVTAMGCSCGGASFSVWTWEFSCTYYSVYRAKNKNPVKGNFVFRPGRKGKPAGQEMMRQTAQLISGHLHCRHGFRQVPAGGSGRFNVPLMGRPSTSSRTLLPGPRRSTWMM